jgi:signal peptidase I
VIRLFIRLVRAGLALVLVLAIAAVGAAALPTALGYESLPVYSGSMVPALPVGSLAVVQPVPVSLLKARDIITYRDPLQSDTLVTHRLVSVEQVEDGRTLFRTKGDANEQEDSVYVDPNAVLGRVAYGVPYAGYVVAFAGRTSGRLMLFGVPLILLGLDYARFNFGRRQTEANAAAPADVEVRRSEGVRQEIEQLLASQGQDAGAGEFKRLLESGERSLQAGNIGAAQTAAEAVLAVDPRNEHAWLLKAQTTADTAERIALLRSALLVNPQAREITAELARQQQLQAESRLGTRQEQLAR